MNDLDPRRRFTGAQRAALFVSADGRCTACRAALTDGFHADHDVPHSAAGRTDVLNGAALCPDCNLRKAARMPSSSAFPARPGVGPVPSDFRLRDWQLRCLRTLDEHRGQSALINAVPGGGKTVPAIVHARRLLQEGVVTRVVIVAPTTHLVRQWAGAAARLGVQVDPDWSGVAEPRDFHGIAITYHRLTSGAVSLRHGCREPTLVIADEPHHLGENKAWADGFAEAFEPATTRLLLSGTPFRSDGLRIPGVGYDSDGQAVADVTYSYAEAIHDAVCRAVTFVPFDGQLRWMSENTVIEADFGTALSPKEASRRYRTAIDARMSDGPRSMITAAHDQLIKVRKRHPNAGMLIICKRLV